MRLIWARRASADMDHIEDYIAQDNPYAALETRDQLELRIKDLKAHPRLGRQGRVRGTRELVLASVPYIVVYRVKKTAIEIARVLHGAQQWPPSRK